MHEAVHELIGAGFEHRHLGLLAGEHTVRRALAEGYEEARWSTGRPEGVRTAFVQGHRGGQCAACLGRQPVPRRGHDSSRRSRLLHENDAERLRQQVDEGHLLFVRTHGAEEAQRAVVILSKHSACDARVHTVPDWFPSRPWATSPYR